MLAGICLTAVGAVVILVGIFNDGPYSADGFLSFIGDELPTWLGKTFVIAVGLVFFAFGLMRILSSG